jgi:hypothetical protein
MQAAQQQLHMHHPVDRQMIAAQWMLFFHCALPKKDITKLVYKSMLD